MQGALKNLTSAPYLKMSPPRKGLLKKVYTKKFKEIQRNENSLFGRAKLLLSLFVHREKRLARRLALPLQHVGLFAQSRAFQHAPCRRRAFPHGYIRTQFPSGAR